MKDRRSDFNILESDTIQIICIYQKQFIPYTDKDNSTDFIRGLFFK